ncbi:MAG: hypothetical protein PHY92_00530 [Alphaproteobacteria bacterium]|nr:hypothetical protein [Alphaproteobacteria bacterium]
MAYKWLSGNDIIESVDAVIRADGTAAWPYFGRAHLFTGPRYEIHEKGKNILNYVKSIHGNYANAKFLAPIFGAILIDDTNIWHRVLGNVDGIGLNVYEYLKKAFKQKGLSANYANNEADRIMRHSSMYFVDGLYGEVTTSVCGADRNRIFFDTEFMRMGQETVDLITGLAKNKDIEIVNDGSILEIRKLFKLHAIETAYRLVCVREQDKLFRTAWNMAAKEIMRRCLDVEEFYMIDREQMWRAAAKEIFSAKAGARELIRLDRKLNREDRAKKRSPEFCGSPAERLSQKKWKLFCFVIDVMAKKALQFSGTAANLL